MIIYCSVFIIVLIFIACFQQIRLKESKSKLISFAKAAQRANANYQTCKEWLIDYNLECDVAQYLKNQGVKKAAVYGLGEIGLILCEFLQKNGIQVLYAVDINAKKKIMDFPVYNLKTKTFPETDIFIISISYEYEEILKQLEGMIKTRVMCIDEIILETGKLETKNELEG